MTRKGHSTTRSEAFRSTREQHLKEAAEDYTELIADLSETVGEARTCRIAEELGISHVTALRTMRRLEDEGYLKTAPHRPVVLTPKGRKVAQAAKEKHELLLEFFLHLGVPRKYAELDVEGVEHHISDITLSKIREFLGK